MLNLKSQMTKVGLLATMALPLQQQENWQLLKFGSIPANQVSYSQAGMNVVVAGSASPIIYPFKKSLALKELRANIKVVGHLNLSPKMKQGEKGADDFLFKLGVVTKGEKTLNVFQRMAAADWIKKLFSLAPENQGINHIYFLALTSQKELLGKQRQHPLSDLIFEEYVWLHERENNESQALHFKFKDVTKVIALWLSIDGDDTNSKFSVLLQDLELILVSQ